MFLEDMDLDGLDLGDDGVEPGLVGDDAGNMDVVVEAMAEWHNIELAMIKAEHASIVTENKALLEEAKNGFWEKVKAFFKNLYTRMREMWGRAISMLMNLTQAHTKWLEANETKLSNLDPAAAAEVKVKTYKYDQDKMDATMSAIKDLLEASKKATKEMSADDAKQFVLKKIGAGGESSVEFASVLFKVFRSNKSEKGDHTIKELGGVAKLISGLKAGSSYLAELKNGFAATESAIKAALSEAETASRSGFTAEGDEPKGKSAAIRIKSMKAALVVAQIGHSSLMAAFRGWQDEEFHALRVVASKAKAKAGAGDDSKKKKKEAVGFTGNVLDQFMA